MKFHILTDAVRKAESIAADRRAEEVRTLIQKLVAIWGSDEASRIKAFNVATWRMRRGLSLDIKRVLP